MASHPQINNAVQQVNNAIASGQTPQQVKRLLQNLNPCPTGLMVEVIMNKVADNNYGFAKKFYLMMNPYAKV